MKTYRVTMARISKLVETVELKIMAEGVPEARDIAEGLDTFDDQWTVEEQEVEHVQVRQVREGRPVADPEVKIVSCDANEEVLS